MKVAVVGCGLIGSRRAHVAQAHPDTEVVLAVDVYDNRAISLASEIGCDWSTNWQDATDHPDVEVVVVATVNKFLSPISVASLMNGKHVLCEKPPGRNASETARMVEAAGESGTVLKVGFNHRYHPAIREAHRRCEDGEIGPLFYIRGVYGHGGRPGYDKEWRGDPSLAGGGELLDQGVHVIDLCRWFMGDFVDVDASLGTYFWDIMPLEDNAFVTMRTAGRQVATFHTSWTQWKNRFSFEVFGRDGYVAVEGLGGSYGTETLTVARRRPESGPPDVQVTEFDGPDDSWSEEWADFVGAIGGGYAPLGEGKEALAVMRLLDVVYKKAKW